MKNFKTRIFMILGLLWLASVSSHCILAAKESESPLTFTLKQAIETALKQNPLAQTFAIVVDQAKLNLKKVVQQKWVPKFDLSFKTGLVPEARGDIFNSPDRQSDLDGWGPFYKLDLKIIQPIYTFGKISAAAKAARLTIDLASTKEKSDVEKFKMQIINAYWALASASEAGAMANDLRKNFHKLMAEVEARLKDPESEVDDTDLLEVKSNQYQIEDIYLKTVQGVKLSRQAFNIGLGLPLAAKTEVMTIPAPKMSISEKGFELVLRNSIDKHYSLKGLQTVRSALEAKKQFVRNQKKPVIYLAAGISGAYAPHRADQTNPFVYDPFNYGGVGAFIGFDWDLNFFRPNYASQQLDWEKKAVSGKIKLLRNMITLEISRAFADVQRLQKLLSEAGTSLKAAKTWLRLSMDNWDMGIGEVNRIIKAYNAYYQLRGIEIKREYDLNIALAKFAFMVGNIDLYSQWVEHEKVYFQ